MSSRLRAACLAGLFVGCAAVSFVGCSSDDSKKRAGIPVGEGGEAGEHAAGGTAGTGGKGGTGGAVTTPEGGEGGTPTVGGEAGQGGAPVGGGAGAPEAGAPAGGESGATGAGPLACTPTGDTSPVTLPTEFSLTACRGAQVSVGFTASNGDPTFTCCGLSNAATPYSVTLSGTTGDGGGKISFVVPDDAPFGDQNITATCSSGDVTNSIGLSVSEDTLPVVTDLANSTMYSSDTLVIDGSHLDQVSRVRAVSVDDSSYERECAIDGPDSTADSISCSFDGVAAGDYYILVEQDNCGSAVNLPVLTIQLSQ
jgi:hypothetical protein